MDKSYFIYKKLNCKRFRNNFKSSDSRFNKHIKYKIYRYKILTGDPYKGTYIEPQSQRPPSSKIF